MKKLFSFLLFNFVFLIVDAQIPSYVPTDGLVAWYPFNDNANDESGNGNNGTVNGATLTTDRFGNEGKAYSFNGLTSSNISVGNINVSGDFSLSFWEKSNITQFAYEIGLGINNTNNVDVYKGYGVGMNDASNTCGINNKTRFIFDATSTCQNFISTSDTVVNFNWNNITVTREGIFIKLFVNGILKGSGSNLSLLGITNLIFGMRSDNFAPFNGLLDDITIYNRALTREEVNQLYSGTKYAKIITNNDTTICKGNTITLSAKETLTITDIDGNTYPTVKIGSQIWTAKNLDVSKYKNGDTIPQVTDPTEWANLTTGAWCWYNNDNTNGSVYGKLYNWYAVNDPRGLAPEDWHVPTDGEWNKMTKHLDSSVDTTCQCWSGSTIGTQLKNTTGWNNGGNGTNSSGFTGLQGHYRGYSGDFANIEDESYWWSSSAFDESSSWRRILFWGNSVVSRYYDNKSFGFSIRIIKDNNFDYQWSTGDTTSTISVSPTQTTKYYCTITDGVNAYRDSVTINVFNPNLFAQDTIKVCGSSYTLDAGAGQNSYSWNTSDTTQLINVTTTGWYECTVSNGICSLTDSVFVSIINANILNNDTAICKGAKVDLKLHSSQSSISEKLIYHQVENFSGPWQINWPVNQNSKYKLRVSGLYGIVSGPPHMDAAYGVTINAGLPENSNCTGYQDRWRIIDGCPKRPDNDNYNPQHEYEYSFNSNDGVVNIDFSDLWYDDNSGALTFDLYEIDTLQNALHYYWSTTSSDSKITVSPLINTKYFCTNNNGIHYCKDSVTINVFNPNIFPQDTIKICGSSYTLNAGSGYNSYSWNTGDSSQTINVTTNGWYVCTVSNGICSTIDSVFVSILNANILNNDTIICLGNSFILDAQTGFPSTPITDIDGNVYPIVNIGSQNWTAKNLNVSIYRNGDIIPQVTDPTEWANLTTGAWCYYNNDSTNGLIYGKLYNWYAVNDPRGLAPEGWHVPSDIEWLKFVNNIDTNVSLNDLQSVYLSETSALKIVTYNNNIWNTTQTDSVLYNSSGFSALPGGYRYAAYDVYDDTVYCNYTNSDPLAEGNNTKWWSSSSCLFSAQTEINLNDVASQFWLQGRNDGFGAFLNNYYGPAYKKEGNYVRCVRDVSYDWSNRSQNGSTLLVNPIQDNTYYLTVNNGIHSCSDSVTINVFNPNIFPQDTLKICGSSYILDAGAGHNSYSWNTGDSSQTFNVTTTGWYACTVSNGICSSTDSVFVSIINARILNNDTAICKGASISLELVNPDYSSKFKIIDFSSDFNFNLSRIGTSDVSEMPTGEVSYNNIPFLIYPWNNEFNGWIANFSEGPNPRRLKLLIGEKSITSMSFLANTFWGAPYPTSYASIQAWSKGELIYTKDLFGNIDIRDFNNYIYTNTINNQSTVNIWSNGARRIDMVNLSLSTPKFIDSIFIIDYGENGLQRIFILAATIKSSTQQSIWSNGSTDSSIIVSPINTSNYYCTTSNGIHSCIDSVKITVAKPSPTTAPASITITPVNVNVCEGKVYRFSAPALPAATATTEATGYLWSFTGSVGAMSVIDSGTVNSRTILVRFNGNATASVGDSVRVCYYSVCGNSKNKSAKLTNVQTKAPVAPASITVTQVAPNICNARVYRFTAPALPATSGTMVSATGWKWSFKGSLAGNPFGLDTANAVIDSGDVNSRVIVVRFKTNVAAAFGDSIRVCFNSACGYTANKSIKLPNTLLNVPAVPSSITVTPLTANICGARKYRYTAPLLPAATTTTGVATGYQWSITGSLAVDPVNDTTYAVIDSGNINSRIIVVRYKQNRAAALGDSVRVFYTSNCGNSTKKAIKLSNTLLSVPAVPASITINAVKTNVCTGKLYRYTAPALPASTTTATAATGYEWTFVGTLGANASIDSGSVNSKVILVRYSSNAAAQTGDSIKLRYTSACGTSSWKASKLTNVATTLPGIPASITPSIVSDVCGARVYRYTAPVLPAATANTATASSPSGYLWTMPTGSVGSTGTITSGNDTSRIIEITYSSNAAAQAGDSIKLSYTTATCGNSKYKALKLTNTAKSGCPSFTTRTMPASTIAKSEQMSVKVFPNPSHKEFNFLINSECQLPVDVNITDVQGKLVKRLSAKPNQVSTIGNDLQSGVYFMKVIQGKQMKTVKLVKE